MSGERHHFNIGDLECIALLDLGMHRPVSQLFPHIPEADRNAAAAALNYDPEAIPFSFIPLAIESADQWLLVDTGITQGTTDDSGHTLRALNAAGIAAEDINTIFITHCHGDHIGGLTDAESNLTYPNANVIMWRGEWDYWMSDEMLASMEADQVTFLQSKLNPIRDRLTLIDIEGEIAPGVTAVPMPGHTAGHSGLRLESNGETLLHMVDCAHMAV